MKKFNFLIFTILVIFGFNTQAATETEPTSPFANSQLGKPTYVIATYKGSKWYKGSGSKGSGSKGSGSKGSGSKGSGSKGSGSKGSGSKGSGSKGSKKHTHGHTHCKKNGKKITHTHKHRKGDRHHRNECDPSPS